jgi:cell surface hyaluronidase
VGSSFNLEESMKPIALIAILLVLSACGGAVTGGGTGGGVVPPTGGSVPISKTGLWSEAKTWPSGQVPKAGEAVTIPAGTEVTLDVDTPNLEGLNIQGNLKFADKDLALTSKWIMVHGRFEVGTPERPYTKRAIITLTGTNSNENALNMGMGTKLIGVMSGGVLELHGEQRNGWTRLASTAAKGATQIGVQNASGWRVGDEIVLASTDYNADQAEVFRIGAIAGNSITLAASQRVAQQGGRPSSNQLRYEHYSDISEGVEMRGEVGLLTRNITVRGDDASSQSGFGGHIMAMQGGWMRVSGVELWRMGQRNILGRYPIHWHLAGDVKGQYIWRSSIWQTFNRCVTIHAANYAEVVGNVAYDSTGHCYFLEDGAETKNLIEGNLGIRTRRPDNNRGERPLIPTDTNPATFWISHPDNIVRNNAAAGSHHTGFWYALPEHPVGASKSAANDANVFPRRTPLGEFSGNVAHSNWDGLMVDRGPAADGRSESAGFYPKTNPSLKNSRGQLENDDAKNPPVMAEFKSFTAYKNRGNAAWFRGEYHKMTGARLSDNAIGVTFASSESTLENSLIVGDSANKGTPEPWECRGSDGRSIARPWDLNNASFTPRGFEFYDGEIGFKGVEFRNFNAIGLVGGSGNSANCSGNTRESGAMSYLRFTPFDIAAGNFAEGARFTNAKAVYFPPRPEPTAEEIADDESADSYRAGVFVDRDGSVGGTAGASIVFNQPLLVDGNCQARVEWNAQVCRNTYARLSIQPLSTEANFAPISLTRNEGDNPVFRMWGSPSAGNNDYFAASLIVGRIYTVNFSNQTPSRLRLWLRDRRPGESIRVAIPGGGTNIYRDWWVDNRNRLQAVNSLAELDLSTGDRYFLDGSTLYLKMVVKPNNNYATLDICRTDLCR